MFQNLPIKTRFYLFIAAIFFALILSYQLAIKNTANLYFENSDLSTRLDSVKQGSAQIHTLKAKLDRIKNSMGASNSFDTDIHQEILNTCSRFCTENNLLIREYPDKELIALGNSQLEINKISIEGGFHKSLRLVHQCEQNKNMGRILSVQFEKQKDVYTQKERLLTTIFFQSILTEK